MESKKKKIHLVVRTHVSLAPLSVPTSAFTPPLLSSINSARTMAHSLQVKCVCPEKNMLQFSKGFVYHRHFLRAHFEQVLLAADLTPHDGLGFDGGSDEDDGGGDDDEHDSVAEEGDDAGVDEKKVAEEIPTRKVCLSLACVRHAACGTCYGFGIYILYLVDSIYVICIYMLVFFVLVRA